MEAPSLIALFVRPLSAAGIPYLVTGGVASIVYGEPRLTRGIDLVLALRKDDAATIAGAFPEESYYVPPLEVYRPKRRARSTGTSNRVIDRERYIRARETSQRLLCRYRRSQRATSSPRCVNTLRGTTKSSSGVSHVQY